MTQSIHPAHPKPSPCTVAKEGGPPGRRSTPGKLHLGAVIALLTAALPVIAAAQAAAGAWVYPSPAGNLLYQLDSRGQRINDFSNCGYGGGTEPLPNLNALNRGVSPR